MHHSDKKQNINSHQDKTAEMIKTCNENLNRGKQNLIADYEHLFKNIDKKIKELEIEYNSADDKTSIQNAILTLNNEKQMLKAELSSAIEQIETIYNQELKKYKL